MKNTVDVIIPVYKPDHTFERLLEGLTRQTIRPDRILVINTGKKLWEQSVIDKAAFDRGYFSGIPVELYHVTEKEFDHGKTRRMAAERSGADYMLFMTQDAVPEDEFLVEELLKAFDLEEKIGVAYARQLPAPDCGFLESYTRSFNYDEVTRVKSAEDLPGLGIKTFFCSDVCAMYCRERYEETGGFTEHTIFNEDMICAGQMIRLGLKVAYAAKAQVVHSHNYTGMQQMKRNFDLAVSQADHPEVFSLASSESEGIRLVKNTIRYLLKQKKSYLIPKLIWQSGCKYLGYKLGKNYRRLPKKLILHLTSNKNYWKS